MVQSYVNILTAADFRSNVPFFIHRINKCVRMKDVIRESEQQKRRKEVCLEEMRWWWKKILFCLHFVVSDEQHATAAEKKFHAISFSPCSHQQPSRASPLIINFYELRLKETILLDLIKWWPQGWYFQLLSDAGVCVCCLCQQKEKNISAN